MITHNWTIAASDSAFTEQVTAIIIIEGDYEVTYQPKAFIFKPTKDTVVKFVSANSTISELTENTNSTGIVISGGTEITFDPMDSTTYKIVVKGLTEATSVRVSALRYTRAYERQISKLSSGIG